MPECCKCLSAAQNRVINGKGSYVFLLRSVCVCVCVCVCVYACVRNSSNISELI